MTDLLTALLALNIALSCIVIALLVGGILKSLEIAREKLERSSQVSDQGDASPVALADSHPKGPLADPTESYIQKKRDLRMQKMSLEHPHFFDPADPTDTIL